MRGQFVEVEDVDARFEAGPHPHAIGHMPDIEAFWRRKTAANDALYNGRTVLATGWRQAGGRLELACREVDYATLIHFLDHHGGPEPTVEPGGPVHFFGSAVITGSDGRIVVGRMAGHSYNAGKVYMPSGSFEPTDFVAGRADFHGNMAREVMEETGLDLSSARPDPGFAVYDGGMLLACFRIYRFDETGDELAGRAGDWLATGGDGELSEVLAVEPGQVLAGMPRHVTAFMARLAG